MVGFEPIPVCRVTWMIWLAPKFPIAYRADGAFLCSGFLSSMYNTYNKSDICAEPRSLDKLSSEWDIPIEIECTCASDHPDHPRAQGGGQNTLTTPQKAQTAKSGTTSTLIAKQPPPPNVKLHLPRRRRAPHYEVPTTAKDHYFHPLQSII